MTNVYKCARQLTPEDAAYLAGLVDGEGTIGLTKRHRNEQRHVVLSISSTERQLLEWALMSTGVGKITRKRVSSKHHAPGFTYAVSNRQALAVLGQIVPHLKSYKRRRAELVLALYSSLTPRNGKYTAATLRERREFETTFASIRARDDSAVYESGSPSGVPLLVRSAAC